MRQAIGLLFHALQTSVQEVQQAQQAQQAQQEQQRNNNQKAHNPATEVSRNHSLAGVTHFKNASVTTTITAVHSGGSSSSRSSLNQHQGCSGCAAEDGPSPAQRKTSTKWQSHTRLASAFFGFVAMCNFAAACAHMNKYYVNANGSGDWTDGFALVAPLLSTFLNPLAIIRNLWKKRTTHHALRVAMDTILFILGLVSLIYAIAGSIVWYLQDAVRNDDGSIECASPLNAFSSECAPIAYKIWHEQLAGAVFLGLLALCQLGLGISGVIAWAKERREGMNVDDFEMEMKANSSASGHKGFDV